MENQKDTLSIIKNIIDTSKWRIGAITPEQIKEATERMDKEKEIELQVHELANSPIDLRDFIIQNDDNLKTLERYRRALNSIARSNFTGESFEEMAREYAKEALKG